LSEAWWGERMPVKVSIFTTKRNPDLLVQNSFQQSNCLATVHS
jgi:hypothetical protein